MWLLHKQLYWFWWPHDLSSNTVVFNSTLNEGQLHTCWRLFSFSVQCPIFTSVHLVPLYWRHSSTVTQFKSTGPKWVVYFITKTLQTLQPKIIWCYRSFWLQNGEETLIHCFWIPSLFGSFARWWDISRLASVGFASWSPNKEEMKPQWLFTTKRCWELKLHSNTPRLSLWDPLVWHYKLLVAESEWPVLLQQSDFMTSWTAQSHWKYWYGCFSVGKLVSSSPPLASSPRAVAPPSEDMKEGREDGGDETLKWKILGSF